MSTTATVVNEERLIFTAEGNNKFWHGTVYDDGTFVAHWGPVGYDGQKKEFTLGSVDAAQRQLESKKKEKIKKGYEPQRILAGSKSNNSEGSHHTKSHLRNIASKEIDTDSVETSKLVVQLAEANIHNIKSATTLTYDDTTGLFATPLGIVEQSAVTEARDILAEIGDLVAMDDHGKRCQNAVNKYLKLVPMKIKMGKDRARADKVFPDLQKVQEQNGILDSLQASLDTLASEPQRTKKKAGVKTESRTFNVKLHRVHDKKIVGTIEDLYGQTRKTMHACYHLRPKKVFTIKIESMAAAFEKDGKKVGNVKRLWHGTSVANLLSIFYKGLIIPPSNASHCTGRMFGNGIYASDQSTKALNYAYGYWSGRSGDNNCFMFLLDFAMGKVYTPTSSSESLPKAGYDSTFAKAGKSGVYNNEMIVYRTSQVNPVYLVQFGN